MNRASVRRILNSYLEVPVARILAKLGLSPNIVTGLGLVLAGGGAYLLSAGFLWAGGIVLLASGLFDLFDGALARLTDRVTRFGALLDSVADRVSEAAFLLGLLIYFIERPSDVGLVLVYLALVGSLMVSYLRARAEGLGIECNVGVMTRPERVVTLGIGLILGHWWLTPLLAALGLIAGLTLLTSAQRLIHSGRSLKE
jgi:CDP-diacylglycerol--glycerol-3-phosphate 3-phosphatidyltransferase